MHAVLNLFNAHFTVLNQNMAETLRTSKTNTERHDKELEGARRRISELERKFRQNQNHPSRREEADIKRLKAELQAEAQRWRDMRTRADRESRRNDRSREEPRHHRRPRSRSRHRRSPSPPPKRPTNSAPRHREDNKMSVLDAYALRADVRAAEASPHQPPAPQMAVQPTEGVTLVQLS
jgi:hypothetical protein